MIDMSNDNTNREPGSTYRSEETRRNNYASIPNIVDDMDLSPYAVRLYMHIRRRIGETPAGEDDKVCFESTTNLGKYCKMSKGQIFKCKKELKESGLIFIEKKHVKHGEFASDVITLRDIWRVNEQYFELPKETRKDAVIGEHKNYQRSAINATVVNGFRHIPDNDPEADQDAAQDAPAEAPTEPAPPTETTISPAFIQKYIEYMNPTATPDSIPERERSMLVSAIENNPPLWVIDAMLDAGNHHKGMLYALRTLETWKENGH
jgi:hypothetical protein